MKPTLLLIDDDKDFASDFIMLMESDFYCLSAKTASEGLKLFNDSSPDIILLDLMLNDGTNGLELLKKIMQTDEQIPVIMITDYASTQTAVEAIKLGALDYISKTPNLEKLKVLIKRSLKQRIQNLHTRSLEETVNKPYQNIIGKSEVVVKMREQIHLFSQNDQTVLITGESGVGKELVARQIHLKGSRKNKPFVAINCSAIPKDLLESELFGHEKGAFTGALSRKLGKFEIASEGTIFLDEISEFALQAQVKLLRVLQEREFNRVGGLVDIKSNARIIAASNKNLREEINRNNFREDLFYRLAVLPIHVPTLAERIEDVEMLANHFLRIAERELNKKSMSLSDGAFHKLKLHSWPGNIRELKNCIVQSALLCKTKTIEDFDIQLPHFDEKQNFKIPETWEELDLMRRAAAEEASRRIEKLFLNNLLAKFNGNITKAAEHIGITRISLHKMIRKSNPNFKE